MCVEQCCVVMAVAAKPKPCQRVHRDGKTGNRDERACRSTPPRKDLNPCVARALGRSSLQVAKLSEEPACPCVDMFGLVGHAEHIARYGAYCATQRPDIHVQRPRRRVVESAPVTPAGSQLSSESPVTST
jgi:hypothetical protein